MKLRKRQKRKPEQALDALASVTKIWSEWQLGKKASKGVKKAKSLRPPGKVKRILSLKWVKVGGAVAVAGGTAAVVGKKLKGDDPADYSGPAPSVAADAAVPSPDTVAPLTVAPDPATQERDTETVGGESTLKASRDGAAADSPEATATSDDGPSAADLAAAAAAEEPMTAPPDDAATGDEEPAAEADAS